MKNKTKKKVYNLIEKIRKNLDHVDYQMSNELIPHIQRVTEMQCDTNKLNRVLWKAQKEKQ